MGKKEKQEGKMEGEIEQGEMSRDKRKEMKN